MKTSRPVALNVTLVALFLSASALVFSCAPTVAQAEGLTITGARLKLVQGSPEDMMRYPAEPLSYWSNTGDLCRYPSPRVGDIVEVRDEYGNFLIGNFWPRVTIYWEDCGASADFDFFDYLGFENGHMFALVLSSSDSWQWLENATADKLAGTRYVEIQGIVPSNCAQLLAKLPKHKAIVRCGAGTFPSLPAAILPIDPVGLIIEGETQWDPPDFRVFTSCTFLAISLEGLSDLQLPPGLKILHLSGYRGDIRGIRGAENSLEAVRLGNVARFSNWMVGYGALKDVVISGEFARDEDYLDFTKTIVQLPALRSLRFEPMARNFSFISALKTLKCLWMTSKATEFAPLSSLTELECLWIELHSDCDFSALSPLKNLKYLALDLHDVTPQEDGRHPPLDLATLAPVAGKVSLLRLERPLRHPELFAGLSSLEILDFSFSPRKGAVVKYLASLVNLRHLSGLEVLEPDISPLSKLTHLECLDLKSIGEIDLSGLKECVALRDLSVEMQGKLNVEPLISLPLLTRLSLVSSSKRYGEDAQEDILGCKELSRFTGLKSLTLRVSYLRSIEFLRSLRSLMSLDLAGFEVTDLSALAGLESLQHLSLSCRDLGQELSISLPCDLRTLSLSACAGIRDLSFLDGTDRLSSLMLWGCSNISELPKLRAPMEQLKTLCIGNCQRLVDTSGLASMPALQALVISGTACKEVAGFDTLKYLRYAYFNEMSMLEHLPKAAPGVPLVSAHISAVQGLKSLEGIETWRELRQLDLELCEAIKDISPLASLAKLMDLKLSGGTSVEDIKPLAKMTWLKSLGIVGCPFATAANIELLKKALPECLFLDKE